MTSNLLFGVCAAATLLAGGAQARQTTEYANLTPQGTLPLTGGAGGLATYGITADGDVIAFHTNATDIMPGVDGLSLQVYVRDRRHATTVLASVSTSGAIGNGDSHVFDVSWQGRYIVFRSFAGNLDAADGNTSADMFVRDLETSTTSIVSLGTGGIPGTGAVGYAAAISADGRFVAFDTYTTNWVLGDTNNGQDVYVRDRATDTTTLVSVALGGGPGNGISGGCHMSDDGRYVVFSSGANDLVPGDTNGKRDVFLRDMLLGTTTLVSVATSGALANQDSLNTKVSNDGRFVVFYTSASNLDPADTNTFGDIYVRDLLLGTTQRVSLGINGIQLNHNASLPSMSADGSYVAFATQATNHGFADGNGFNPDIFVVHVPTMTLIHASQSSGGVPASQPCDAPLLSGDGQSVLFVSFAANLVPGVPHNNFVNLLVHDAPPSALQGYCFGDGSGTLCPCGPTQSGTAGTGCANSSGMSGRLSADGNAQVSLDTVTLTANGMSSATFAMLLQGTLMASSGLGAVFGDGLLCVGGTLMRLSLHSAPAGSASYGFAGSDPSLASLGAVPPIGGSRFYQAWYRDALSFCTAATFNLTNAVEIGWVP